MHTLSTRTASTIKTENLKGCRNSEEEEVAAPFSLKISHFRHKSQIQMGGGGNKRSKDVQSSRSARNPRQFKKIEMFKRFLRLRCLRNCKYIM